jgi:hypothetical protein
MQAFPSDMIYSWVISTISVITGQTSRPDLDTVIVSALLTGQARAYYHTVLYIVTNVRCSVVSTYIHIRPFWLLKIRESSRWYDAQLKVSGLTAIYMTFQPNLAIQTAHILLAPYHKPQCSTIVP